MSLFYTQPPTALHAGGCIFYDYTYPEISSWSILDHTEYNDWGVGYITLYTRYAGVTEGQVGFYLPEREMVIAIGMAIAIDKEIKYEEDLDS